MLDVCCILCFLKHLFNCVDICVRLYCGEIYWLNRENGVSSISYLSLIILVVLLSCHCTGSELSIFPHIFVSLLAIAYGSVFTLAL